MESVADQLSERTRVVAVTAASNLIGTMPDVHAIAERVHAVGALLYVDGVHYAAHGVVDVCELGADFFACSPYKFLGPHCGVVAGRRDVLADLRPAKLLPSTDEMPDDSNWARSLTNSWLERRRPSTSWRTSPAPRAPTRAYHRRHGRLEQHEDGLRRRIEAGLGGLSKVTVHSRATKRTPTLLLTFVDRDAAAVSMALAA